MTAPWFVRALTHPEPKQRREAQPRPNLTVVPDAKLLRSWRLARLFTAIIGLAICFGLFGVVGVRVLLAQGQTGVARLQTTVQQQRDAQEKLRMQVSELEAPARVVSTARDQLGMVPPADVVTLGSADLANPPATVVRSARPATVPTSAPKPTSTTTRP